MNGLLSTKADGLANTLWIADIVHEQEFPIHF